MDLRAGELALTPADTARAARRAELLSALGEPQRAFAVVHVAGSNGKGSTVAMLAAMLQAAGHRVGRFTSPDLQGPHERFWLAGQFIAPAELAAREAMLTPAFAAAEANHPDLPPLGPFERWCAVAWTWLAEHACTIAVVEAGVGGATDATNVFERPLATLVTSVGLDHQDRLGADVAAIARNKAGIFRGGVPALTSATGEAAEVMRAVAARVGAPFAVTQPLTGQLRTQGGWTLALPDGPAHLALPGTYQLENAGLAVAAAQAIGECGWAIDPDHLRAGLAGVTWPGRLETLADDAGGAWLLDGAHNPAGAAALIADWGSPAAVVAGFRADKAAGQMVEILTSGGATLIVSPIPGAPSWSASDLAPFARGPVVDAADLGAALGRARTVAPAGVRVVTGSLWLVGAARALLLPASVVPLKGAA